MQNNSSYYIMDATEADTWELLSIYAPYVEKTAITFEYEVPSLDEFASRIQTILREYPYLVWRENGRILGYAYAGRELERAAYQWNAELSVYVREDCVGKGIGEQLYHALLDRLTKMQVLNVYALVTSPNERSDRLHKRMGFERTGLHRNTGYKLGAWHDVTWYYKCLGNPALAPQPWIPYSELKL